MHAYCINDKTLSLPSLVLSKDLMRTQCARVMSSASCRRCAGAMATAASAFGVVESRGDGTTVARDSQHEYGIYCFNSVT